MEQKKRILIIDDDVALQTVLEIALRESGYEVIIANDGEEGIEKVATVQPNLIISDIMMPQMDGVEAFMRVKEHLQDNGIPILIMTALNRKPWFAILEAEGAVILHKPFEIDKLMHMIHDMLL